MGGSGWTEMQRGGPRVHRRWVGCCRAVGWSVGLALAFSHRLQRPPISCRGDEADRVRMLKEALGLSDEDAAPAHIDVARRLYRQGFETKDRQQQFEQRKVWNLGSDRIWEVKPSEGQRENGRL